MHDSFDLNNTVILEKTQMNNSGCLQLTERDNYQNVQIFNYFYN